MKDNKDVAISLGFEEAADQPGLFRKISGDGVRAYIDFRLNKRDGTPMKNASPVKGRRYALALDGSVINNPDSVEELLSFKNLRVEGVEEPKKPMVSVVDDVLIQTAKVLDKANREISPQDQTVLIKLADDTDEKIITEQVVGATPLVYQIADKYSLSVRGWVEAARRQGDIKVMNGDVRKIAGVEVGYVTVRDEKKNIEQIGVAERYTSNDFKVTVLISKAVRNGLAKIVSPVYEQEVIQEALKAKSVLILKGDFGR